MKMTNEQRELLTIIMNNKETLEELLKATSTQQKQAKDLQMKESISLAGIAWSKFAEDVEGNAYMLADEIIYTEKFGDSNDWRESPLRNKLNNELYQKIVEELGADSLITIQTDLLSYDGLSDYGKCEDMCSLLTHDLYRNNRENIKNFEQYFWTCTPDSTPSGRGASYVRCVYSDGYVDCNHCDWSDRGVRPFFILKSDVFVSCERVED